MPGRPGSWLNIWEPDSTGSGFNHARKSKAGPSGLLILSLTFIAGAWPGCHLQCIRGAYKSCMDPYRLSAFISFLSLSGQVIAWKIKEWFVPYLANLHALWMTKWAQWVGAPWIYVADKGPRDKRVPVQEVLESEDLPSSFDTPSLSKAYEGFFKQQADNVSWKPEQVPGTLNFYIQCAPPGILWDTAGYYMEMLQPATTNSRY
jgi:hypothetical protein